MKDYRGGIKLFIPYKKGKLEKLLDKIFHHREEIMPKEKWCPIRNWEYCVKKECSWWDDDIDSKQCAIITIMKNISRIRRDYS